MKYRQWQEARDPHGHKGIRYRSWKEERHGIRMMKAIKREWFNKLEKRDDGVLLRAEVFRICAREGVLGEKRLFSKKD
jgi:hypothetical protein